ncbi:MAG TPA: RluA family pseudouridine synthase, partial [Clostridiaceae bacterium]|nr:RluA family pseudouridine synthase [Clostridiaceae bacterium]
SKEVITKVKMLESVGIFSEVEVNLITGRSHQIRAHLSYLNNPIIGDTKYGDKETNKYYKSKYGLESQLLIGYKMIFKNCSPHLKYLDGKVVTMPLPPIYKKIRKDLFKF